MKPENLLVSGDVVKVSSPAPPNPGPGPGLAARDAGLAHGAKDRVWFAIRSVGKSSHVDALFL